MPRLLPVHYTYPSTLGTKTKNRQRQKQPDPEIARAHASLPARISIDPLTQVATITQTMEPVTPKHPAVCATCNNGLSPRAGARMPHDFECQRSHDWRGLNVFLFCRWCGRRISPLVLDQFLPLLWEAEGQLWQSHGVRGSDRADGPRPDRGAVLSRAEGWMAEDR